MPINRKLTRELRFGGATQVQVLADAQQGPTCGLEAIENVIQLFNQVGNDLVEQSLLQKAKAYGAIRGSSLDVNAYTQLLKDYGIVAHWYPYDPFRIIIPALSNDRAALVVLDAYNLDPGRYLRRERGHAVVLTNYCTDITGTTLIGYIGIDSNVPNIESYWPRTNFENAISWTIQRLMPTPVLITDAQTNWPYKAKFYKLSDSGQLVPVH